jgi:hypothetical protein
MQHNSRLLSNNDFKLATIKATSFKHHSINIPNILYYYMAITIMERIDARVWRNHY